MEFWEYGPTEHNAAGNSSEQLEDKTPHSEEEVVQIQGHKKAAFYSMSSRTQGIALIINNKTFHRKMNLKPRNGSEADVHELTDMLRILGFITIVYEDLPAKEIIRIVRRIGRQDHKNSDSLFICILSYGNMTYTYASDGRFRNDDLFWPFHGHRCPSLAGKPKVFLLQMFSVEKSRKEDSYEVSAENKVDSHNHFQHNLPVHADILIAYNEVPELIKWKSDGIKGSPYVQEMCRLIRAEGARNDLLSILTICNSNVLQILAKMTFLPAEKYVTCTTSTLTRKIVFSRVKRR